MKFKKGDIVEIVSNIPFDLLNKVTPIIGTIIDIDEFYILVKPKYKRYACEFYANEIRHYKDIKKERKLKLKKINKFKYDSKNL